MSAFEFTESRMRFSFDKEVWTEVFKFDEHPDYLNVERFLNGYTTKDKKGNRIRVLGVQAVDFIGLQNDKLFFIEIKNFRPHPRRKEVIITEKEELTAHIGHKVKDSLACLVGGRRNSKNDKALFSKIVDFLNDEQKEIYVILWMEHETKNTTPIGNNIYLQALKKKLQWLTDRNNILICNHTNCPTSLKIKAQGIDR